MTHDYDAITRAIKDAPLGKQLRIIREIVEAKDFQEFTSDALFQMDEALDDMDAQAIELLREEDVDLFGASA
jgi:hypothetical protein